MAAEDTPVCTEIVVSATAGGKIAINDYGKRTSDWGIFMSQKFTIPEGWTQDQVDAFHREQYDKLYAKVDELDQREHDVRWEAKEW
jgi:hypothetical protein